MIQLQIILKNQSGEILKALPTSLKWGKGLLHLLQYQSPNRYTPSSIVIADDNT